MERQEAVKALTDGKGCETVIEAVGVPETFEICQNLVAPGGIIANVGVHGTKVDLHLESLCTRNIGWFQYLDLAHMLIPSSYHNSPCRYCDSSHASEAYPVREAGSIEVDHPR